MSAVVVDVRGTKEAIELLDSLSGRELKNRTARATRRAVKVARPALRAKARSGDFPSSYTAKGGIETRNHRTPIGTSVGPVTPLFSLFEPGVSSHRVGGSGELLRGAPGEHYRSGPFLARGPVEHPGFAARPLVAPVFEAKKDEMTEAAMDELLMGLE